ncbi:putative reverse transcriptase domain-containing protein [Tanacetum coccineum]
MEPKRATRSNIAPETTNTTSVTNVQLQAMINQGVTDALAALDADKNTNSDDNHILGVGTEGVSSLSQWFKRMESVFHIRNYTVENQVKFATCTLYLVALTWWNTHVMTVGHDAAYGHAGTNPNSNVVTGTFLINNRYASILFDTGADRSLVSTAFSSQICITPTALDHYYDIELADGRIIGLNTILRGCTLNILNHPFNIDLMPVELGSFNAIIGLDWLPPDPVVAVYTSHLFPTIGIRSNQFPEVKGWLDEDLDNYHLKELRCSTQCHTQMSMWIISRGVVLLILLMEYKVLRDFLLHRSSINNSARLSNKFGGFYFSFKFDISGLLHHVITTIAYRIRGGSLLALKCLVWFMKYYANVRRTVADFSHAPLNEYSPSPDDKKQWSLGCWFGGKLIQKLRQKGVYEESFSRHAAWIGGKLIQFMHTTMVPVQVKTMKIQAGIQVSRPRELTRQLQLWKCFGRLYFCCICT